MIAGSTVSFDRRDQVMRCSACFAAIYVSRAVLSDPDRFIDVLENAQIHHADCRNYQSVEPATNSRRGLRPGAAMQPRHADRMQYGAKSHLNGR